MIPTRWLGALRAFATGAPLSTPRTTVADVHDLNRRVN
jgi:hypothetical protein